MRQLFNFKLFTATALLVCSADADVLTTTKAGRPAAANLKVKQSGVPQLDMYQKKNVGGKTEIYRLKNTPRIDVGEEPTLQSNQAERLDLPELRPIPKLEVRSAKEISDISIEKYLQTPIATPGSPQIVTETSLPKSIPSFQEPTLAEDPTPQQPSLHQEAIQDLSPTELKLLQALIFLEIQKNYPMALGLFAELLDEAPEFRVEATYNLAFVGRGLGLYSEYRHQMLKVLNEKDLSWQKKAIASLVENAGEGDLELVSVLDPKIEKLKVELTNADQYNINRAKYYLEKEDLKTALVAVAQIAPLSTRYPDALFLKGVLQYRLGEVNDATVTLETALAELNQKAPKSELQSIASLTLARLYFQIGDYKKSFQSYLGVDKSHPEWPQAMIEQAWTQILYKDYEGAAGNMFSLHTDFFKNTFAPESYIVRTVSYLNLCQFGDGARVVQELKRRYTPIQSQIQGYQEKHKNSLDYYETVKSFMRNPDAKEIDGLPRNFVWALARTPTFITEQKYINSIEEQISRYNKITLDLIAREKFLLNEQNQVRNKIVDLKKRLGPNDKSDTVAQLEKRLLSFKVQHFIVKKARTSIKNIRAEGLARVEKEKLTRKTTASQVLAARLAGMRNQLTSAIDQTDVLQYELYAGAGEHLRYQAAGGEIDAKESAGLKPEENKQLKWEYKGEVWEDELGHYRSSLKNVCPETEGSSQEKVTSTEKGVRP